MSVFTATNVVGEPREEAEIPSLVDGIRAGQPAALERLVARVQARVLRWARRYTDDDDGAQDVAQEVLIGLERSADEPLSAARSRAQQIGQRTHAVDRREDTHDLGADRHDGTAELVLGHVGGDRR